LPKRSRLPERIIATLIVSALWIVIFTALHGDSVILASYARELQSQSDFADYLVRSLSRDHVQLPSVASFMALAVLWAPVLDHKLAAKQQDSHHG
jgi:hypothetical protein